MGTQNFFSGKPLEKWRIRYRYATYIYKGNALVREGDFQPIYLIGSARSVVAIFPKDLLYIDNSKAPAGISGDEQSEYPYYTSSALQQRVDERKGGFLKWLSDGLMGNKGQAFLNRFPLKKNLQYLSKKASSCQRFPFFNSSTA
jgi:hypothetical protein